MTLNGLDLEAAEAAIQGEVRAHHLYAIEVVDMNDNLCSPNREKELPLVKVEGLALNDTARVVVYDQKAEQGREIGIEKALQFRFVDSAVYDIVEVGTGEEDGGTGDKDEGTGNRNG